MYFGPRPLWSQRFDFVWISSNKRRSFASTRPQLKCVYLWLLCCPVPGPVCRLSWCWFSFFDSRCGVGLTGNQVCQKNQSLVTKHRISVCTFSNTFIEWFNCLTYCNSIMIFLFLVCVEIINAAMIWPAYQYSVPQCLSNWRPAKVGKRGGSLRLTNDCLLFSVVLIVFFSLSSCIHEIHEIIIFSSRSLVSLLNRSPGWPPAHTQVMIGWLIRPGGWMIGWLAGDSE